MCAKFATDLRMRRDFIHTVPSKLELIRKQSPPCITCAVSVCQNLLAGPLLSNVDTAWSNLSCHLLQIWLLLHSQVHDVQPYVTDDPCASVSVHTRCHL